MEVDGVKTSVALIAKGVPVPARVTVLVAASNVLVPEDETIVKMLFTVVFPNAAYVAVVPLPPVFKL